MKITIRMKENAAVLDLEGNIDINSSNFIEAIGWTLLKKSKEIICNFEGINLVDYIGISIIVVAYKNILNHKGQMKFYNISGHIKQLFSVVGLDRVLECYDTEEAAFNSLKREKIFSGILKERLRRRFKRIPFKGIIRYKQKFSPKNVFYKGKILNLSAIGVFVVAEKIFSIGEIITIQFDLSPQSGVLEIDSKIVWIADEEIQALEYPAMGLEFYNISSDEQQKIISFVEKHLASDGV